jgi:flagellar motor switch protein FliG
MDDETIVAARRIPKLAGDAAAAILLTLLGEDEAAAILGVLEPDEVRRVGAAMLDVAQVSAADVEVALEMFVERSRSITGLGLDAQPRVRSVMTAALGDVRASTMLASIAPQTSSAVLEKLRWLDAEAISAILASEHPQVGALVIACLTPENAAAALAPLNEDLQADLIYRAASLAKVNAGALADLEQLLDRYASSRGSAAPVQMGGRSDAAKIVTRLAKGADQRVLKSLKKRDKQLAQEIEDDMFVFDDLLAMDAKNMGALLRLVDAATLTLALRGAPPATIDKMLGCLSARAADSIRDEMAESPPAKRAEVEEAQKQIAATARSMAADGSLMLGGKSDDYV